MPAARISSRRFEAAASGTSGKTASFPGRGLRKTGVVAAADSHQETGAGSGTGRSRGRLEPGACERAVRPPIASRKCLRPEPLFISWVASAPFQNVIFRLSWTMRASRAPVTRPKVLPAAVLKVVSTYRHCAWFRAL